jgi:hypothetical protein
MKVLHYTQDGRSVIYQTDSDLIKNFFDFLCTDHDDDAAVDFMLKIEEQCSGIEGSEELIIESLAKVSAGGAATAKKRPDHYAYVRELLTDSEAMVICSNKDTDEDFFLMFMNDEEFNEQAALHRSFGLDKLSLS